MGAIDDPVVAVVGLGYVGLPLAVAFGARCRTLGYDLSPRKTALLGERHDPTGEVGAAEFARATRLAPAAGPQDIGLADIVVIAVPTPVDDAHRPDLGPLLAASRTVGQHLKRGATVVYESTVYPGATEEACVPALEGASGMRWKRDFFVGYSPERINPGDGAHRLRSITKVVAGDTPETLERVAGLYARVVEAGIHRAPSIRVAEAAKVIENTQRDLNIALMNELAIIFHRMGLDTKDVLDAAGTKWNFLRFTPGLVGGHCIGVDPYYLTHQAERMGYHPEVILAGRRINDGMGKYVARQAVKCLVAAGRPVNGASVSVLGITFKEDCPDLRNSRVIDLVAELRAYGVTVRVHDPRADAQEAMDEHGIALEAWEALPPADAVVIAVAHREFVAMPAGELARKIVPGGCLVDVKSVADREAALARGIAYWRL